MKDDVIIRKAVVGDVPDISATINIHAPKGIMLPRPISQIYDNVRDYHVVECNGKIIGCGALHVTWSDLAEIRALSIQDEFIGKGYGKHIVEKLLEIIKKRLIAGEDVLISGFGKWSVRSKHARKGRNPKTGERMILDARRVVTWSYSPVLKKIVNESER